MENYKYFKDSSGTICRIHIEQDSDPWCPRYDMDGNIGHMMCWWNRYQLGDYKENKYNSPEDFVNDLVRTHVSEKSIINYIKAKKTINGLELKYNRKEKMWELWGYYYLAPLMSSKDAQFAVIADYERLDWLIDDIIESMSFEDKWKLLERNGVVALDLHCYEHGGITMSCSSGYPYNDRWDGGQAGWIYTTKEEVLKCGGMIKSDKGNYVKVTERNWKNAAYTWMRGEVEMYDQYLQGEVYGYIIDELDMDDQASLESKLNVLDEDELEWNEHTDSCWGYFSNKWGDDLIEEIVKDGIGNYKLYDSPKELVA